MPLNDRGISNFINAVKRQRNLGLGYSNFINAVKRQRNLGLGYSNFINAVKRQRNLGLHSMVLVSSSHDGLNI
jgi:ribosomal protein L20